MKINHLDLGFPCIEIENTYNEKELELIWEELNFLCYSNKLYDAEKTGSGTKISENNEIIYQKKNKGIFLDNAYSDRNLSNILTVNRKIFNNFDKIFLEHSSWFFKNFFCEKDFTLISYYENGDYYDTHVDGGIVTILTWFYKKPKKFEGGNLSFPDFDYKVFIEDNYTIIFPSMIKHLVEPVIMNENDIGKKYGRFCMTQFTQYELSTL